MKTRTPIDRNDLRIKKSDKVIEIGPGHNPSFVLMSSLKSILNQIIIVAVR